MMTETNVITRNVSYNEEKTAAIFFLPSCSSEPLYNSEQFVRRPLFPLQQEKRNRQSGIQM